MGGIETWIYNLAKIYGRTHKFAVFCGGRVAYDYLKKVFPYIEIKTYNGQKIRTKKAIFCYDFMGIHTCEADEIIHVIHADYNSIPLPIAIPKEVKIDKFVSVSEVARKGFKEVVGHDSEVVYNPHVELKPERLLRLVSGTRLTTEKGLARMQKLAWALDKAKVLYEWQIFTNSYGIEPFSPNVLFRQPTNDILSYVAQSDYLVQLSDSESYGYSIIESLLVGTPIIVTAIPVLKELGINSKHGVIVPLEGADYDELVKQVVKGGFKFSYKPPKDKWGKIFGKGSGNDYIPTPLRLRNCFGGVVTLVKEDINLQENEEVTLYDKTRADELVGRGFLEYVIQ